MATVTQKEILSFVVTAEEVIELLKEKFGNDGEMGQVTIYGSGQPFLSLDADVEFKFDVVKEQSDTLTDAQPVVTNQRPLQNGEIPVPRFAEVGGCGQGNNQPRTAQETAGWNSEPAQEAIVPRCKECGVTIGVDETLCSDCVIKYDEQRVGNIPIIAGEDDDYPVIDNGQVAPEPEVEEDGDFPVIDDEFETLDDSGDTDDFVDRLGDDMPIVDTDYEEVSDTDVVTPED